MEKYQKMIGDGKLPNKYFVFHYDQKYQVKKEDGESFLEAIKEDKTTKDSFLGEFNTYKEALNCVDNKAFLPNVIIEDRISGQVFEQFCIVCPCCGKEDWETNEDYEFTKKLIEEAGKKFE